MATATFPDSGTSSDCASDVDSPVHELPHDGQDVHLATNNRDEFLPEVESRISDHQDAPVHDAQPTGEPEPFVMESRAYQLEMLDKSLSQNAIVAMDTGSGKTQIALLRIKAELERCAPNKIIWFLAPTVSLCAQQHEKLRLPAISSKLLTGNENVDTWSKGIWDVILSDTRIVVSTYQVLLDALSHAFVTMANMALIVFDEAHNCTRKHPGSKIMNDFYHPAKAQALQEIPAILGLTASPSMSSHVKDLDVLEATLDARCISPTLHREELLKFVHKPEIVHTAYKSDTLTYTPAIHSLQVVWTSLNIADDPYILQLKADPTERNLRRLRKAVDTANTFCQKQIKGLLDRAMQTFQQLGSWAADYFIWKARYQYMENLNKRTDFFHDWMQDEKTYLADALSQISVPDPPEFDIDGPGVSNKLRVLIEELVAVEGTPVGIVFARERSTVAVLADVLASLPCILAKYRIESMVGTSNFAGRRSSLYDFQEDHGLHGLQNFKSGLTNLLVATSVLEEGIDVPACNLVICFDLPDTPKSFIQRRGRARMRQSKLLLFLEASASPAKEYEALEEEMKRRYQDEQRALQELQTLEDLDDTSSTYFVVESSGARLDFDNAKQHLGHFCRSLSRSDYVDSRPDYIIEKGQANGLGVFLTATVLLPTIVPTELRRARSKSAWRSEKSATKDAAYQAYLAFYHAGLLDEHLLPFKKPKVSIGTRSPRVETSGPFSPWHALALGWKSDDRWLYHLEHRQRNGDVLGRYQMILPLCLEGPPRLQLYVRHNEQQELHIEPSRKLAVKEAEMYPDHTSVLVALHLSHRRIVHEGQQVLQVTIPGQSLEMAHIGAQAVTSLAEVSESTQSHLIRTRDGSPFWYEDLVRSRPAQEEVQKLFWEYDEAPEDEVYLSLRKWTRRIDFLHPDLSAGPPEVVTAKKFQFVYPLSWARMDAVPKKYAEFGMLLPSIMHEIGTFVVAKACNDTLLRPLQFRSMPLLLEALSARSAGEPRNYERLEFLGDSILKFCATVFSVSENPEWPEGYLSFNKDRLVSNHRLSQAALDTGLSQFILHERFKGKGWKPLYVDEYSASPPSERQTVRLSTKTLADVVEALIGASFVEGGMPKAIACISFFVEEVTMADLESRRNRVLDTVPPTASLPATLEPVEDLISYEFEHKALLLETLTHASHMDMHSRSYERLEFLGDAILDKIMVSKLFAVQPPLAHHQMHLMKTAMVNADFLAFLCFEHTLAREETIVVPSTNTVEYHDVDRALWQFMRHSVMAIGLDQQEVTQRHRNLRNQIHASLSSGTHYPWAHLARLQAKKFYSDLVEALIGAVWVDCGSLEACEAVLAQFGLFDYLERLLRDGVQVRHPKEELGILAGNEKVDYDVVDEKRPDGSKTLDCQVRVGDRVICAVQDGVTRDEVMTKAAEEAVRILQLERDARPHSS